VTRSEAGYPLATPKCACGPSRIRACTGAITDAGGRFEITGVPVGNVFLEAVNVLARAQVAQSDFIPVPGAVVERDLTLLDVEQRKITVKHGTVRGHVYRDDGVTAVAGVPVYAYYESLSQPDVRMPLAVPAPSPRPPRTRAAPSSSWT
jgi:hypothetical protein